MPPAFSFNIMKNKKVLLIGVVALFVLLLLPGSALSNNMLMDAIDLIISFEGFRSRPYWDVSRYSWGYGTPAPGEPGTISESQARIDLMRHVQQDYDYLRQLIYVPLSKQQWAALLSFSYNLGPGNAANLVDNINAQDNAALGVQWNKYVNAGGVVNSTLVDRRSKEWAVWNS